MTDTGTMTNTGRQTTTSATSSTPSITSGSAGRRLARPALALATTLVGLSAGFFFTYQYSVILGLAEVDDVTYVETFQAINATIRNPAFGLVFFGSIPALLVAIALNWSLTAGARRWLLGAALPLYLTVVAVTFAGSVPLNEELAEFELTSTTQDGTVGAATVRVGFEDDWNRLNLIRTVAAAAALASLAAAGAASTGRADQLWPGRHR